MRDIIMTALLVASAPIIVLIIGGIVVHNNTIFWFFTVDKLLQLLQLYIKLVVIILFLELLEEHYDN